MVNLQEVYANDDDPAIRYIYSLPQFRYIGPEKWLLELMTDAYYKGQQDLWDENPQWHHG